MYALRVFVTLLVLLSATTVGVLGAGSVPLSPPVAQVSAPPGGETIRVLGLPPGVENRTTIEEEYVDVGPALALATNRTSQQLETRATVERIESAGSDRERRRRIEVEIERLDASVDDLGRDQRRALGAYLRGDIGAKTLLIRLARIGIDARGLETRRERVAELAREQPGVDVRQTKLGALARELDAFTGPVRNHAMRVVQGAVPPARFYVSAGTRSVALSTIYGGAYVRESYRGDLRFSSRSNLTVSEARNITAKSYPTVWETRRDTEVAGTGGDYLVRVSHARGDLSAFVDGGSRQVFKEFHRRPLDTVDDGPATSSVRDGLRLTVNRTYPGGPLRVALVEAADNRPTRANITIGPAGQDSVLVGQTGTDGVLWTLSPEEQFTVTAIRGNSVVFVTVDPRPLPRVEPINETERGEGVGRLQTPK